MRRAFEAARAVCPDYFLWLNDDTYLHTAAIKDLLVADVLAQRVLNKPTIIVGTTTDSAGTVTYGGWISRRKFLPLSFHRAVPDGTLRRCDAMNGNCVLVPWAVARRLGNLDAGFTHAMADIDYGMRARRAGFEIRLSPQPIGFCAANELVPPWDDRNLGFRARWRALLGPKGLPLAEWLRLTMRHGGMLWPLYFASPYFRTALRSLPKR